MIRKKSLQEQVIYQIYIRSFKDSDGDGIGDIPGVIEKLDYLKDLGVDMLWLSPFCSSPNDDMGYDISDYRNIMKEFGSMGDFDRLLAEAHRRDMGIMMDLVLNHTSDEHPWFMESRKGKDNPKRDYYIWADEPNNWDSYFCPDAWEYDPVSRQYYLHIFGVKQPDLNWRNPGLRREIFDMVEWWLKKGVDGFRFDAIHLIGKPEGYPDYVSNREDSEEFLQYRNTRQGHDYLREMHNTVLSRYGNPVTVGETGGTTPDSARFYVDKSQKEFDMIFHLGFLEEKSTVESQAAFFREFYSRWYKSLSIDGWDALFLGNHDLPRFVSVLGDEEKYWKESATCLATMLLTQWGTPFLYQGDEIGMINAGFDSLDQFRDPHTTIRYTEAERKGEDTDKVLADMILNGRDNSRTPMQWNSSPHGGFSTGTPWIGMARKWEDINVEAQQNNPDSILSFYKKAITLRKSQRCLAYGSMRMEEYGEDILAYRREYEGQSLLVLLNLSSAERPLSEDVGCDSRIILSNYTAAQDGNYTVLRPWEALVLDC